MAEREAAQVFVDDLDALTLDDEDEQHLATVLRLRAGEVVVACDGAGAWRRCVVGGSSGSGSGSGSSTSAASRRRRRGAGLVLEPTGEVQHDARPEPTITIAFALVKGDRPEWAVQKLTELGVDRIVPLITERSVVRPAGDAAAERVGRLQRVARGAAMQCRRRYLPEVDALTALGDFLPSHPGCAVAAPSGAPPSLERPAIVIGPEGGWGEGEIPAHMPSVRLGPHVLRTETAAVVAASLLVALRDGLLTAGSG